MVNILKNRRIAFTLFIIVSIILISSLIIAAAMPAKIMRSKVYILSDMSQVRGGSSTLSTNQDGAIVNLHTQGLAPNHAVTLWWVIFNKPWNCKHPEGPFRCGPGDLPPFGGDNSAQTSILYADGHVVNEDGTINFNDALMKMDVTGALWGPGLVNTTGADIHLIVRDHGKIIPGMVKEQISTFNGGCDADLDEEDSEEEISIFSGSPSSNICTDVQFAVHEQNRPEED